MKSHNQSDYELIKQFIQGNQSCIEVLINRYKRKVFTYIMLIVKDQPLAEDIFQETFIKVIKSLRKGKYREEGKFLSWVMRIAHNLTLDYYRKQKHLKTISNDNNDLDIFNSIKFSEENVEDKIIQEQISKDVRSLIDELPDDQKQVILLRHYGDLSFKEIAEQTNVSINTALGRMRYALINLRKLIAEKKLSLTRI